MRVSRLPLSILVGTFLAPACQAVSVPAILIEAAFIFPLLAPATTLLFHAVSNSMASVIFEVSSLDLAGPQVVPVLVFTFAHFAPVPQTVFESVAFAKLALVFPLSAFVTLLHF
jgi:hypothetical protein